MATSIITALLVVVMAQEWGGYTLAVGVVGGALVETGLIGWRLTRQGISLIPRWCGMFPAVKSVLAQYAPSVAAALLMGSITVVSQSMAATLPPGTVAVLSYGNKLTNLILGIGATAVSMAVLPHFSRMVTATDWQELRHTLSTYTRLLLIILIPLTTVLIYFSEPLMAMFFQRGAFTEADTHLAGQVQVFCLLQIPVYIVGRLFVGLISALKTNQLMMWGNIINLCVCIVLNYALMQWLGVLGLALAASLLYAVSCCFLSFVSLRLINRLISSIGMSAGVILGGKA
jgi:putative peptidoglycan lipid II flippase